MSSAMEEFNFNAPIIATVIFDDSDNETKPSIDDIQIKKAETSNNLPNTLNELIPIEICRSDKISIVEEELRNNSSNLERSESIQNSQNDSRPTRCSVSKNKTVTKALKNHIPLDMPSLNENNTLQSLNRSVNTIHVTDCQSKSDNQTNNKRKKSTNKQIPPKRRLTKEFSPHVNDNNAKVQEQNTASTKTNQNCFQDYSLAKTNAETVLSNSLKENNKTGEQLSVPTINQNAIQDFNIQEPNADILLPQSLNESSKAATYYLNKLLHAVSEHMISIINSYFSYRKIYKSNIGLSHTEHAYNHFIHTKLYFFDLSYSTVANVILPRENDITFVKNFLYYTIKLAFSKSCAFSYDYHVKPLFMEMIVWVKKRQEKVQIINLNKSSNPLLAEKLQNPVPEYQPPPYPNQDLQLSKSIKESDRNPIYTFKPSPGGNVDPSSLKKHIIHKQPCFSVVMPLQYTKQFNYENQMHNTQPDQNTSYILNENLQCTQNQFKNLQPLPNFSDIHNTTSPWPNHAAESWQFKTTQSRQKQATHSLQKDLSMSTQNFPQNHEELRVSVNNQNLRQENSVQIEPNRSSISRDSGFMSPLNFISNSDQMWNSQEEQRPQITPLISHVTSFNPNVSYISDGLCTVCGQTTKKKCLGCYKCYYCSQACQFLDWKKHKAICK